MRLANKVAIVVGAGQTPGETIGNGRAAALLFAREGAKLMLVDRDLPSAEETRDQIRAEGGTAEAFEADITQPEACLAFAEACLNAYGRIDILHNNVGVGTGDGSVNRVTVESWRRIVDVNLTGTFLSCKAVQPHLQAQESGVILNISSIAAISNARITAYRCSKAAVNALTQELAMANARFGVRVNAIMPGLIDTPMAIEGRSAAQGVSREELRTQRSGRVPLKGGMGTAWDVASAALFLVSDEAKFVTGAILPVDGGQSARVG